MELRQLKYFVKAAETLNFSDAAKAMNIAQSSLSQQVRQLEEELDVQLFIRNSHSISLTEAGEEMLPFALQTIHDAETCVDRIHDLKKLSAGTLNIGVTYSFSPILTETVITFLKIYPRIKLNVIYKPLNELMELLAKHELDFVLAFKPSRQPADVESHTLFQNRLAAVVSTNHALASKKKISMAELEKYDLALPSEGLQARNAFDSIVHNDSHFHICIELNEVNILLKLIRQTHFVTILAEDTIYNEHEVKAIPLDVPYNDMTGCVHILKDTYHKHSMKEFIRLLSESLAVKQRQNSWI